MKKIVFWLSIVLIVLFWPLSFVLANRESWLALFVASGILFIDWILYLKSFKYHHFIYLLLPLIHPVFIIFPVIYLFLNLKKILKPLPQLTYVLILIFISIFSFKTFYNYSIFTPDPLAQDSLIKKISIIPNRNLARIYENKTTVALEKFKSNVFLTFDLNNFFFALHPREIGDNQNLSKYPYLAIIPFLLGLFFLPENKHKKWIITIFISAVISLGLINNPDRFDLILFMSVSLICFYGLKKLFDISKISFVIYSIAFIPLTLFELYRLITFK